ncbi:MAG: nucleotide sugar dehydrogenase [Candidatus Thorarchaeota archaeon]
MSRFNEIKERIKNRTAIIYVIGLGYIGLPTALFYARAGFKIHGIDTDKELIDELRVGTIRMDEEGLEQLAEEFLPSIELNSNYDNIEPGDIFVLCLPSPIDEDKIPNVKYLESSVNEIARIANEGALILVESTVPVGFTKDMSILFGEKTKLNPDTDYWFAHCPERVLPGQVVDEMKTIHRLVGGVTPEATELTNYFLSSVFGSEQIHSTTSKISETAKLAENAFRDSSISFANELAVLCSSLEVDVKEVIQLANLHPRVEILNPGLGVGGYCFPKDGWILAYSAEKKGTAARLIPTARAINDGMPEHVYNRMLYAISDLVSSEKTVGVIGLAYKANVSDTRNSPSLDLMRLMKSKGIDVIAFDPFVKENFGFKKVETLDVLLEKAEIIVIGASHKEVIQALKTKDLADKILIDPWGIMHDFRNKTRQYVGLTV